MTELLIYLSRVWPTLQHAWGDGGWIAVVAVIALIVAVSLMLPRRR